MSVKLPDHQLREMILGVGQRPTPRRIYVLRILCEANLPLRGSDVVSQLASYANQATVYRILDALVESKLVSKIIFENRYAYYEAAIGVRHHHHILCKVCGMIEAVDLCIQDSAMKQIIEQSRFFSAIENHAFELVSTCDRCKSQ